MPSYVTPLKNTAFVCYVGLVDQSNTKVLKANPTLATGDAKVSIDGGAFANLATLPSVSPAAGTSVLVSLSSSEMNGDNIVVALIDPDSEWCDLFISIQTTARQVDNLAFPTVSGRSLDVSATGEAGVDWANVGSPTTTNNLSGTSIATTQAVASVSGNVTGSVGSVIGNVTGSIGSLATQAKADVSLQVTNALSVDLLADSVATDGVRPTLTQAIYEMIQFLTERSVASTTVTVKKVDGTTSLMTFTLDSATTPTSITRAS